ncbi:MAG: aminoglycoside phosphotransferase family protein [Candidatus Promineifilaceae bacterium]|nr:aminoglycoside phosphotransferase family protein [Candidatus Promineifilaceae bacterium]
MMLKYLQGNWERLDLDRYSPTRQLDMVMITPRFWASSHVVFLIFPKDQSKPTMVAKVPRLAGPSASISREVANLRAVQSSRPDGFNSIPQVIACENYAERQVLLETALAGRPMDPPTVRQNPDRCCRAVVNWLERLQVVTRQETNGSKEWYEKQVNHSIRDLRRLLSLTAAEEEVLAKTEKIATPLRDVHLPLVFTHGDLSHPNVMWLDEHQPAVVDWELADPQGLPGTDLFMFLTYIAFARHKTRSSGNYLPAFQEAFFSDEAWAQPYIKSYAHALRLEVETLKALFILTWLRYSASLLNRIQEAPQTSGKLGAKTAAWIRDNRYYQLWQYAVNHVEDLKWSLV